MNKPKIGIIGVGYVGGAVKYWFEKQNSPLFLYDKYKKIGSFQKVNKAEIIFICVPTPFNEKGWGYDDSAIWESLDNLNGSKIVVIKSTVLPGTTEKAQKKFPQHKILFNPEFLLAKTALQDFLKPKRQIIGVTNKSKKEAQRILKILPQAPFKKIVPATEAETIKYFGNAFLATRVIFANQMYDVCQRLGINYERVKECAGKDSRVGQSHFGIFHNGYRGYGGACLPKDTKAFIQFCSKIGAKPKLLKTLEKINEALVESSRKRKS